VLSCCEHGYEPLASITGGLFIDQFTIASKEGLCSMELVNFSFPRCKIVLFTLVILYFPEMGEIIGLGNQLLIESFHPQDS
jgi:hypothetical protein